MVEYSLVIKNWILSGAAIGLLAIVWWGFKYIGTRIIEKIEGLTTFKDKSEVKLTSLENNQKKHEENLSDLYRKQYDLLDKYHTLDKQLEKQKQLTDTYSEKVLNIELEIKENNKENKQITKDINTKLDNLKTEHDKCTTCNHS